MGANKSCNTDACCLHDDSLPEKPAMVVDDDDAPPPARLSAGEVSVYKAKSGMNLYFIYRNGEFFNFLINALMHFEQMFRNFGEESLQRLRKCLAKFD